MVPDRENLASSQLNGALWNVPSGKLYVCPPYQIVWTSNTYPSLSCHSGHLCFGRVLQDQPFVSAHLSNRRVYLDSLSRCCVPFKNISLYLVQLLHAAAALFTLPPPHRHPILKVPSALLFPGSAESPGAATTIAWTLWGIHSAACQEGRHQSQILYRVQAPQTVTHSDNLLWSINICIFCIPVFPDWISCFHTCCQFWHKETNSEALFYKLWGHM